MSEQRLIDASAFDVYSCKVPDEYKGQEKAYIDGMNRVLESLDEAPTIEAQTIGRGRWVLCTGNKYRRTNCGRHTHVDEVMDEPAYNYCPYCGAKIDGGDEK